jgi:hypothetical protein
MGCKDGSAVSCAVERPHAPQLQGAALAIPRSGRFPRVASAADAAEIHALFTTISAAVQAVFLGSST